MSDKICKHKYRIHSYSGLVVSFICELCKNTVTRDLTPKEAKILKMDKASWKKDLKDPGVHKVWYDFNKKFILDYSEFIYKGYEFIVKLEKWAKKYPNNVTITRCDDKMHMGSRIALIDHKTNNKYFGITCVVAPQAGDPSMFFLYPNHTQSLVDVLSRKLKELRLIKKVEIRDIKNYSKMINKLIKP